MNERINYPVPTYLKPSLLKIAETFARPIQFFRKNREIDSEVQCFKNRLALNWLNQIERKLVLKFEFSEDKWFDRYLHVLKPCTVWKLRKHTVDFTKFLYHDFLKNFRENNFLTKPFHTVTKLQIVSNSKKNQNSHLAKMHFHPGSIHIRS